MRHVGGVKEDKRVDSGADFFGENFGHNVRPS
jgi:hypothetical protein